MMMENILPRKNRNSLKKKKNQFGFQRKRPFWKDGSIQGESGGFDSVCILVSQMHDHVFSMNSESSRRPGRPQLSVQGTRVEVCGDHSCRMGDHGDPQPE